MDAAAERVGDGDALVRAALQDLLKTRLLPGLGPTGVAPFVPLLMAHVCAALTHLSAPVRWVRGWRGVREGPCAWLVLWPPSRWQLAACAGGPASSRELQTHKCRVPCNPRPGRTRWPR